jgi:hypothetical protein
VPAPPDDELTRVLRHAGIDIDADLHARLTDAMRRMNAAELPIDAYDVVMAVRGRRG